MKGYVANTDYEWYRFLRDHPGVNEVNFWKPAGSRAFKALQPGEPLIFKLKKAYGHRIVGFGLFLNFTPMTVSDAWSLFGAMNGVPTRAAMLERVHRYVRRLRGEPAPVNHRLGAILLVTPVFFSEQNAVRAPEDWADNTVAGKTYDLSEGVGARVWQGCLDRVQALDIGSDVRTNVDLIVADSARRGRPQVVLPRLGQGTFRLAVQNAYQRCAVSGEHSLPALDAAHIVPWHDQGPHSVDNGLLLRADIHRLYDRDYVSVTPDYEFVVSDRLREEFDNGKAYYAQAGRTIWMPDDDRLRPNRDYLATRHEAFLAADQHG